MRTLTQRAYGVRCVLHSQKLDAAAAYMQCVFRTHAFPHMGSVAQMNNVARWRRRADWLRAAVGVSTERHQLVETPRTTRRRVAAGVAVLSVVHTLLKDVRLLAHDDGDGKPQRYLSWYGGMVTCLL